MPENHAAQDQLANLSLLLLGWILEFQDGQGPDKDSEPEAVGDEIFAAARIVSGHLLEQAERRGVRPTASAVQERFASLVSAGCRTADGSGYFLQADDKTQCIIGYQNPTPLHRCLISGKLPPQTGRLN